MKKVIVRLVVLGVVVALGYEGYKLYKEMPKRQEGIATAKVQRGDVVIRAFTRGELRAVRSYPITAPNLFGTVQVTELAPMGALSKEKDLIVEYDDSERQASLEEARLEMQSVDENIKKLKADQSIQQSQDKTDLLKARYAVRRAELEVQRNPVIDAIDGKKNILELDKSRRALQQLETNISSRLKQFDSQMAVYQETRNRNMLNVRRELQRIAQTRALTPIAGLVAIKPNRAGNFNFGQQMPDIRVGDELQPGMPVADILDLSEMEVIAKVGELDRANLTEGQEALLQLDSIPEKRFRGKIKSLSGTATTDVFSGDPSKKFDVVFSVNMPELLAGLGMKPAEIDRIMATAAENAKKELGSSSTQGGGLDAGGRRGGFPGQGGGGMDAGGGRGGFGTAGGGNNAGGGRGGFGAAGGGMDAAGQGGGRRRMQAEGSGSENPGSSSPAGAPQGRGMMAGAEGRGAGMRGGAPDGAAGGAGGGRRGGGAGFGFAGGGTGRAGDNTIQELMNRYSGSRFTDDERANAKLPLPPEQDSDVQALLRPGLLSDVEIIVEKIPDALHVPAQAIFQKNGQPTVFVQAKNGRFEPRTVKLAKQSESMMVLTSGVNPGEVVALSDPTAEKDTKKEKGEKKSQAGPMGAMGGGKQ